MQVPAPLVIVNIAPTFVHTPELLYATARPEFEVAATVNCELKVAVAGACVPTVIVWFALLTFSVKLASVSNRLQSSGQASENEAISTPTPCASG